MHKTTNKWQHKSNFCSSVHFVTEKFSQDQLCTLHDTRADTPVNLETERHYLMQHTIMPDGGLPVL